MKKGVSVLSPFGHTLLKRGILLHTEAKVPFDMLIAVLQLLINTVTGICWEEFDEFLSKFFGFPKHHFYQKSSIATSDPGFV